MDAFADPDPTAMRADCHRLVDAIFDDHSTAFPAGHPASGVNGGVRVAYEQRIGFVLGVLRGLHGEVFPDEVAATVAGAPLLSEGIDRALDAAREYNATHPVQE